MPARWTRLQDDALRRLYAEGRPVAEIAAAVGRSADAVTARRRLLRVPPRRAEPWSEGEDELLRAATAGGVSASRLAEPLRRSADAVRWRRLRLLGPVPAPRRYTAEEDVEIRRAFVQGGDIDALARRLGRSADAVRARADVLGVHRPRRRRRWTYAEDAVVRDGYDAGLTCASIADALSGRSAASVATRARKLGLTSYARRWSSDEDRLLERLYRERRSTTEIARVLTRTPEAVRRRARRLRITARAPERRSGGRWTEHEDDVLRMHAGANPAMLAELLGRSHYAVAARLRKLGLRAGRDRSPHHAPTGRDRLSPAQRAVVAREADAERPHRVIALAHRLELPPERVRAALRDESRAATGRG